MDATKRVILIASLFGVVTAAAACGDDDDDDGGSSGVPNSRAVSDLSAAESMALCEELAGKTKEMNATLNKGLCAIEGLTFEAQDLGTCEDVYAECIAEPEEDTIDCSENGTNGEQLDCPDVTVGEFRSCFDALIAQAKDSLGGVSCESDLSMLPTEQPEQPAQCTSFYQKCPEFAAMTGM